MKYVRLAKDVKGIHRVVAECMDLNRDFKHRVGEIRVHIKLDPFIRLLISIMDDESNIHWGTNTHGSASTSQLREDEFITCCGVYCFRAEFKDRTVDLQNGILQLANSMRSSWPVFVFGPFDAIVGLVAADNVVSVEKLCFQNGCVNSRQLRQCDLSVLADRIRLMDAMVRYALYVKNKISTFEPCTVPVSRDFVSVRGSASTLRIDPNDYILRKKMYVNGVHQYSLNGLKARLIKFYNECSEVQQIDRLEVDVVGEIYIIVKVSPVGLPIPFFALETEVMSCVKDVCKILHQVHTIGWTHLDLRWSNIIWNNGKPVIIDWEHCRQIGTKVQTDDVLLTLKLKCSTLVRGRKIDVHHDYYLVGWLLKSNRLTANSPLVGDLMASDFACRKRAFMSLVKD